MASNSTNAASSQGVQHTAQAPLFPPFGNVLDMIGRTPMLELRRMEAGPCRLFGKLELMNPAGSIKDRIGLSMIEGAERAGKLNPKGNPPPTIVEATAGNTGIGLALVALQRGYRMKIIMPDKMSQEKIQHLRAMGAEVILTRSDVQRGHPEYFHEVAARIARETPNALYVNQFSNPDNTKAHYESTGPEVWEQLGGKVDAMVLGVGSGGTLSGMGKYMKEKNPACKIILADPMASVLHPLVNEGRQVEAGSWLVEGMGEDFVPDVCDLSLVDEAIAVNDGDAFMAARQLLASEGILAGSSTGCLVHAALTWCRRQTRPMNVVTLICDSGAKYLSKFFNDFWMVDNGFIKRESQNNLRDLIARRHSMKEDYTLCDTDPIKQAIKRMQMYGVSQMAVLDARDRVVGIIDESDILIAAMNDEAAFEKPVSEFMTRRLETVRPEASIESLTPIFRADRVAIVMGVDGTYYGLITKIDMINYLRQQADTKLRRAMEGALAK